MAQAEIFAALKEGTLYNVYLFYGTEVHVRRKAIETLLKRILPQGLEAFNLSQLNDPTADQIIDCCETLPMMSERRAVIVRECKLIAQKRKERGEEQEKEQIKEEQREGEMVSTYLSRIPQTTVLIFDAGDGVDGRKKLSQSLLKLPGVFAFNTLGDEELYKWINQTLKHMGKQMSRAVCEQFVFTTGRDLTALMGELQKLAAYSGDEAEITARDVDAITTRTMESNIFKMLDAMCTGRAKEAFGMLNMLLQAGENRIGIIAMITRQVRLMTFAAELRLAGRNLRQIAGELAIKSFAAERLLSQAERYSSQERLALLKACVQTDYDVKRGALREDAALERLMLRILTGEFKAV